MAERDRTRGAGAPQELGRAGEEASREEIARLAELWGGDLARWPEASRARAARRIAEDPAAAALVAEAAALDAALDALAAPALSEALTARLLADAADMTAERRRAAAAESARPRRTVPSAASRAASWLEALAEALGLAGLGRPLMAGAAAAAAAGYLVGAGLAPNSVGSLEAAAGVDVLFLADGGLATPSDALDDLGWALEDDGAAL